MQIEENLRGSFNLLSLVYPRGLPEEEYYSLLKTLYEDFSNGNLAKLISLFTGKEYGIVYNDILGSQSYTEVTVEQVVLIRNKLIKHGYEFTSD